MQEPSPQLPWFVVRAEFCQLLTAANSHPFLRTSWTRSASRALLSRWECNPVGARLYLQQSVAKRGSRRSWRSGRQLALHSASSSRAGPVPAAWVHSGGSTCERWQPCTATYAASLLMLRLNAQDIIHEGLA